MRTQDDPDAVYRWRGKVAAALLVSGPILLLMGGLLVYQLLAGTAAVFDKSSGRDWTSSESWVLTLGFLAAGALAWCGGVRLARSARG